MLKETPASRHAKRSQIVMGSIAFAMFIGFPILFVFEAMGHAMPVAAFLIYVCGGVIGFIWMHWVKCPKCGTLVTEAYTIFSPTSVKSECKTCGRSTSAPYDHMNG